MNFITFNKQIEQFPIFSTQAISKIAPNFDSRRLNEWQAKGYINKIVNRWYMLTNKQIDENLLFYTANKIYKPSYISFQSAMAFYGLIPEGVFSITSSTTIKTNTLQSPIATFVYHHLKPSLFFGYKLISVNNIEIKIAEIEKCILDYLYINNQYISNEDFNALRLNKDLFNQQINKAKLRSYLSQYQSKALEKRIDNLLQFIEND